MSMDTMLLATSTVISAWDQALVIKQALSVVPPAATILWPIGNGHGLLSGLMETVVSPVIHQLTIKAGQIPI